MGSVGWINVGVKYLNTKRHKITRKVGKPKSKKSLGSSEVSNHQL